jgi:hypothetical protein
LQEDVKSGNYRRGNLSLAGIFINEMHENQLPPNIRLFVRSLCEPKKAVAPEAAAGAASSSISDPLREGAKTLAMQARKCTLRSKPEWMDVSKCLLDVLNHSSLASCQKESFDVPVGPVGTSRFELATPEPDLAFGLATTSFRPGRPSSPLDAHWLVDLPFQQGIDAFPSRSENAVGPAFPCILLETRAEYDNLFEAENRAAYAAAKVLAMAQTLIDGYSRAAGAQPPALPVINICSQGCHYEVSVAFDLQTPIRTNSEGRPEFASPGVHMVRIWAGAVDLSKTMFEFQILLQRVLDYVLHTWRPTILRMLEMVRDQDGK